LYPFLFKYREYSPTKTQRGRKALKANCKIVYLYFSSFYERDGVVLGVPHLNFEEGGLHFSFKVIKRAIQGIVGLAS